MISTTLTSKKKAKLLKKTIVKDDAIQIAFYFISKCQFIYLECMIPKSAKKIKIPAVIIQSLMFKF
jgi:hypothetical protein